MKMFNKREKVKKEFLKYQDGKIQSFEDKDLQVKKKTDMNEIKEKTEKQVKAIGPKRLLMALGAVVLVIMTIYILTTSYGTLKDSGVFGSKDKPDTEREVSTTIPEETKETTSKPKTTKAKNDLLIVFNQVNNSLYIETINDFARLNDYNNRVLNRISLSNSLNEQLANKEKVRDYLIRNESLFTGSVTEELMYETLLARVDNSISLSNGLIAELDLTVKNKNIDGILEEYNNKETVLKENEINVLRKYLDKKKIEYRYDEKTKTLKYDY